MAAISPPRPASRREGDARACLAWAAVLSGAMILAASCETYDSPPRPEIQGLTDGVLSDREAPIVVTFSEPIVPDTLKVQVVELEVDEEGNLPDEDDDDATVLNAYFGFNPETANNFGGTAELSSDNTKLTITPTAPLPLGPSLAVLLEPGLADKEGRTWDVRQRLVFGYGVKCDGSSGGTDKFPSGTYFFVADVVNPIPTQIQLWGRINVDPETGLFRGQFTNADRNPDPSRCDPPCDSSQACRLLPSEECVLPSEKAGSEDEFPDFLPNETPPSGYSFTVEGCVIDTGDAVAFVNLPADVDIQQPDVFVQGIQLISSFSTDENGVFRGTGPVTAEKVFVGETESGAAQGTLVARLVPEDEVPDGVPSAPDL
ncbi:MAG: hypothetical protein HOW73_31435 [Polyangiaceae bacterium]|nr:hypothetical protein [Polyangiaceae bacterium]